jgi:hypothetical protein
MSNAEQRLPASGGARGDQGISNHEVKSLLLFPSAFVFRYSISCGSLFNFYTAREEVFA